MKVCSRCKEEKYDADFVKNKAKSDGLSCYCKECKSEIDKENYAKNEKRRAQVASIREDKRRENIKILRDYLLSHSCVDCGNSDIRVLEFDHVTGDKDKNITKMIGGSTEKLLSEIEKCEVRCANCHRIRHQEEFNSWRC